MSSSEQGIVRLSYEEADAIWGEWLPNPDDLLARAAFDRTIRWAIGIEDDGLYFRPGGWVIDVPATLARIAVAAGILAAGFQIAGLEDLGREVIIAAAGLVSTMEVRAVHLTEQDRILVRKLREADLEQVPVSAEEARRALPSRMRKRASKEQVKDAMERLVRAGFADRDDGGDYVLRAPNGEAWIRLSLGRWRE
jgi:hypothetical protein